MKYKKDWSDAQKRLTALWNGEILDRPCIAVTAPLQKKTQEKRPIPESNEAKWIDPNYIVSAARYELENKWWGGESIPSFFLQASWLNCLGGTPIFREDTIWFEKRKKVDFQKPSPFRMGIDDKWSQKYQTVFFALAKEAKWDDFFIGSPGSLPANDLIAMQMGTEEFLISLIDNPAWMADAIYKGAQDLLSILKFMQEKLRRQHAYWYGNAGWMSFWAPQPFISTQADISCMLSPDQFNKFIMPELDLYGNEYGALWYHLDGKDAKQHLPQLLSLPYIRVIQYVPTPSEPPNGPQHIDFYREIQLAGKIIHIAVPYNNVKILIQELDPAKLMIETTCESLESGEQLLDSSKKWITRRKL